ncbi:unnamed protein product [Allacma fusca]|uniref:Uncharacterized protein n=1 Tax=Allacma fusca TaxID=39272 RepID=A0A8J2LJW1_9HEXA|nr:unnamed protein product [Allacma fusca]
MNAVNFIADHLAAKFAAMEYIVFGIVLELPAVIGFLWVFWLQAKKNCPVSQLPSLAQLAYRKMTAVPVALSLISRGSALTQLTFCNFELDPQIP